MRTNRDLLVNVLRHPSFLDGATDTAFFDTHGLAELAAPLAAPQAVRLSALAAALADAARNRRSATVFAAAPSGWRNLASGFQSKQYRDTAGDEHRVEYRFTRAGVELPGHDAVTVVSTAPEHVVLAVSKGRPWTAHSTWPATATTCSSTPRWARCNWLRCRAFRIPTPPSRTARCWRPCRVRCSALVPRSATPSPPGSR